MALLITAQPISFILGAPLSGGIMDAFQGTGDMHGWQWMYLIEAAPAVVLGIITIFYLTNGIDAASWLNREENAVLNANLESENLQKADYPLMKLFGIGMMWVFTLIYLLIVIGVYGINFWLPSIIKASGVTSFLAVGLITAIPYAISVAIMIFATRHAEHVNEKRWHCTAACVLGGIGLILSASFADNIFLTVMFITMAIAGSLTAMALFWSFPGSMLMGAAVAAGIAAINSVGNLDAGATGSMTGGGYPDAIRRIIDDYQAGRRDEAVAGYERWLPLINYENRQCGLLACKALMKEGGVIASDALRHPIAPLHPATRAGLLEIARRLDPLVLRWGR